MSTAENWAGKLSKLNQGLFCEVVAEVIERRKEYDYLVIDSLYRFAPAGLKEALKNPGSRVERFGVCRDCNTMLASWAAEVSCPGCGETTVLNLDCFGNPIEEDDHA